MFNINKSFKLLPGVVYLILCVMLPGCYQNPSEEEIIDSSSPKLKILTRSVSGTLEYPISVYAFSEDGKCKAEKVLSSDADDLEMNLSQGNYRITAIGGYGGFSLPSSIQKTSCLSVNNDNYSTTPLSIGSADVTITGTTTVSLQMAMQVACLNISLKDLPDDVSAVSVGIARQYSKVSFEGTGESPLNTSIACQKRDGVWTTGNFYVLPGSAVNTIFSISTTDSQGSETYGYTYNEPLKAGVPYVLNGSFSNGFSFTGNVLAADWNSSVVLDFNFGPGVNETGGTSSGDGGSSSSSFVVSSIPQAASIWQNHVVALVENATNTSADLILLSKTEWNKVASANSTTNPTDATSIASSYSENGLSEWSIPSKEIASTLKTTYNGTNLSIINNVMSQAGGENLLEVEESGSNARYLCEDAKYTFTFKSGSSSITQGGTSTTYRLRLVKKVHVSLE